jgi:LysR family nitrogen assimilation transcriptional regulator
MDVRQLKYFVAIVDAGSVSKAAQKLFVAQPSLSQQIVGLETELKTKLLLRSSQGVKPTTAGSALYRHARLVLRQMEQIRADVREDGGSEAGVVGVGLPTTTAAILAPPLFDHVRKRFPGIRLQIFESMSGYIGELLPNGRLDLAMLFRDSETAGMTVIPVFDEDLYVMGSGTLALSGDEAACRLGSLANVPLVAPGAPNELRLIIERVFQRHDVELNIVADIDSLPTLVAIACAGSACTILPASALAQRTPRSRPVMRRIVDPVVSRPASVCWSHALPVSAAALAVRRLIVELIGELHASGAWAGITLRPTPDDATLGDTGGSTGRAPLS